MEFFGNQNGEDVSSASSPSSSFGNDLRSSLHPSWQMISANTFIYSAYCKGNILQSSKNDEAPTGCPVVNAISIIRGNSASIQPKLSCKLWYEGAHAPRDGITTTSPFGDSNQSSDPKENQRFRPYIVRCENKYPSLIPYGISIEEDFLDSPARDDISNAQLKQKVSSNNNSIYTGFIHIQPFTHLSHRIMLKNESINHVRSNTLSRRHPGPVACLGPSTTGQYSSPQSLTEQVLLQNYFGINNFILYDTGSEISQTFLNIVAERQSDILKNVNKISHPTVNDAKLSLKILPWNVPSSHGSPLLSPLNIFKTAQMDCYFRTISKYSSDAFESSIYLGPSQILVPKTTKQNVHIQSVPKLLHHVAASALSEGNKISKKFMISVRKFCAEYPFDADNSNIKHAISALTKSTYHTVLSGKMDKIGLTYFPENVKEQSESSKDVETTMALVHDYSPCGENVMDGDDDTEGEDKFLIELGEDIDSSIGKYFQSLVMSKGDREKLFHNKAIQKRL